MPQVAERQLLEAPARSRFLNGLALEQPETGVALRLRRDELGTRRFLTRAEQEAEGRRAEARRAAEARARELEAARRRR